MKYCKRCVMPDTRPGITFDEEGICQGCRAEELKDKTDWKKRFQELETLCAKYKGKTKNDYDCIIAVSGGKDSHYQVYMMKEVMKMNPLLVSVEDNLPMTQAGVHNLHNISEAFGCDIIALKPNIKAQKKLMRYTFEKFGKPTWYIDRLIYTYPIYMAIKLKIPLVVYGENISYEYGGTQRVETPSAINQIENGVASDIPWDDLMTCGVSMKDLRLCVAPTKEEMKTINLEPIYMSYFVRWSAYHNYEFAKRVGFHDLVHEWHRTHTVEDYNQVDSRAYLVHAWMKYPKFGHASATDMASRFIRYGLITREEARKLVKEHDHDLDSLCVRDFCSFLGYSEREFWDIVDRQYNRELFEKDKDEMWRLKHPVWE